MDSWRLTANRIMKYDPLKRNEKGAYLEDEWTSFSDVGKVFSGVVLTLDEYQEMESKYVEAAYFF